MAINTATISVIVAKLHDIEKQENITLAKTIKEVKYSLLEQLALVAFSVLLIVLYNSSVVKLNFKYHDIFFNTFFTFSFIYAVDILRDTGMAIFSIISYRNNRP